MASPLRQWAQQLGADPDVVQANAQVLTALSAAANAAARRGVIINGNGARPEVAFLLGVDSGNPAGPMVRVVFGPIEVLPSVRRGATEYDGEVLAFTDPYEVRGNTVFTVIKLPNGFAETVTMQVTRADFANNHFGGPDAVRIDRTQIGANEAGELDVGRVNVIQP
ncbi:hypothetical protein THAOC_24628, partial [Thalassiosira oceanica]